jgi:hypothetical protein
MWFHSGRSTRAIDAANSTGENTLVSKDSYVKSCKKKWESNEAKMLAMLS